MNTRKRILAAILAVFLLLSAAPLMVPCFPQAQAADDSKYLPYYRDVFAAYQDVIRHHYYKDEEWPEHLSNYVSAILLSNMSYEDAPDICYALVDINHNGFPELLIGAKDKYAEEGWSIYGLYTYTDKVNILRDCTSWGYRAHGYILQSGIIVESGAYSAGNYSWAFYRLTDNDKPKHIESVARDTWQETKYFRGKDPANEAPDTKQISTKQANKLLQSYTGQPDPDHLKSDVTIKWKRLRKLPTDIPALAKPAKLKLSAADSTTLKLKWNKVDGARGYVVYQYHPSTKKYTKLKTVKTAGAAIHNLAPGATYRFAVRAYSKPAAEKVLYSKYSKTLVARTVN